MTTLRQAALEALPTAATKEANDAIEAMLSTYNWPCNTQNAGRAGWEAARKYLRNTTPQQRKPLTDKQRNEIAARWRDGNGTASEIIDMVEAAHGIKEGT